MALQILSQNAVTLLNTIERLTISVQDSNGNAVDPFSLTATLMDLGSNPLFTDTWPAPAVRIKHPNTGQFYVDVGSLNPNTETNSVGEFLLDWQTTLNNGGQMTHTIEKLKIVSARETSYIPELRQMIDKSSKLVSPVSNVFLGYTDSNLYSYLEGGLQSINAYQPSLNFTIDNFPFEYKQILLDAALITGVMSQQLYAVDTDIPNYNDQGTAFVISHQPQLASFLNQVTQRLDKLIPMMKLQLINPGTLHIEAGPNFRLQQLVEAAPSGSIFRGVFFKG